jgi:hypothetical protein
VRRDGTRTAEYAVNLSPGGLCLHLPRPIDVGEAVELAFELPPDGLPLRTRGRVVWCDETGRGARIRFRETGIRFEALGDAERAAILRFVDPGEEAPERGR